MMETGASMKVGVLLVWAGSILAAVPAGAQPAKSESATETVTVQGLRQKDAAVERHFSQSMLEPSGVDEHQYALWKQKLCVQVSGLDPAMAALVERRITQIAARAGAPFDTSNPCHPNAVIYFTSHPQALLDAIAKKQPERIYSHNLNPATITQPAQSWYMTLGRNLNGEVGIDAECGYKGLPDPPFCGSPGPSLNTRLETGLSPELGSATVLVDIKAVEGISLGTLADYLAMKVLIPLPPNDLCKPAPSIVNLMVKDCDGRTDSLSDLDVALLYGLYHSSDGRLDQLQRERLVRGMRESLETPGK